MKKRADGRFQKRITLPNGKSKLLYSTANTEREAVKDFNRQMLALEDEHEKSLNFDSVAEQWATEHFPTLQNNTLISYKISLKRAKEYYEDTPIKEIKAEDIKKYIDWLTKQQYARKTIKERLAVLKQIFTYAVIKGIIHENPCQYIKLAKNIEKSKKREAATRTDESIIKSMSDDENFTFLAKFLLYTGCRRGEAFAVTPQDINYEKKILSITKTVEWLDNEPQIKNSPKTDAGNRQIPLPEQLMNELVKRKKQIYIFQDEGGVLYKRHKIIRGWNKMCKEHGISCGMHQLRHSYTTMLFDAGIDVKTAQNWLGHTDIKTTLDIYTHLSETRQELSTNKWYEYLKNND